MASRLDRAQALPLHYQLKDILLREIRAGRLKPSDRLPTEDQLAASCGVSLNTVRRTLSNLAAAGYVSREQGHGTFVATPAVVPSPRELTSFTGEMARRGVQVFSRVLAQDVIPACGELAAVLGILKGADIFRLGRLRFADGEPIGIQTAHIPLALAPALPRENFARASLYDLLDNKYSLTPAYAREIHSAVILSPEECRLLDLPRRSVSLAVRRVTYTSGHHPFELVHSVMRADRYQVVLDLVCKK